MAEETFCLGTYLLGSHFIKTTQQLAKGPIVAKYGVHAETAHPAARPFVRQRSLPAHLALGSHQLVLGNAMGCNIVKRCPRQLENLGELAGCTLPVHAPQAGIGVGRFTRIDGVGQSAPLPYFDKEPRGHATPDDQGEQTKRVSTRPGLGNASTALDCSSGSGCLSSAPRRLIVVEPTRGVPAFDGCPSRALSRSTSRS